MARPRKVAPQPDEAEALGQDLLLWATEKTEEKRCTWSVWYALRHGMVEAHWKALKQLKEFLPYYEMARAALAQKMHSEVLKEGIAQRYLRMYDRHLCAQEDKDIEKKVDAIERAKKKHSNSDQIPPKDQKIESEYNLILENAKLQNQIKELKKLYKESDD